jgi:hypothetical protein
MASRVGICVVYLVDEPYELLFYKHLEQIRRCSEGFDIRIYAGVNRLAPKYVEHLRALEFVKLCELVPTAQRLSDEHAHYLDQLVPVALSDGATHIATLDVDSFPIDPNWLARSQALLRDGAALVGVLRTEWNDVAAPHPSYMFFAREFHERFHPTFALPDNPRSEALLRAMGQRRLDTGAGYAMVLAEQRLPWAQLLRSNKVNDHPLMGGVYGRMVFHFGAGTRGKAFVIDIREALRQRPGARKRDVVPEIAARNERIAQNMLSEMNADFDAYLRRLLGA